jgi:hypothetical protein
MANEMLKATEAYFYTFSSETGAKVLADLERVLDGSLLTPTAVCDFQAEITPEQLMFMREGQQQVLRYIKTMMKYYKDNK